MKPRAGRDWFGGGELSFDSSSKDAVRNRGSPYSTGVIFLPFSIS
jgi:hypothetical protein